MKSPRLRGSALVGFPNYARACDYTSLNYTTTTEHNTKMRRETTKVLQTLSPARKTRSSANLQRFAFDPGTANTANTANASGASEALKMEDMKEEDDEDASSLSSANTVDIEDILEPPSKRRRRDATRSQKPKPSPRPESRTTPKPIANEPKPNTQKKRPAQKPKDEQGPVQPPSNWETIYDTVKHMRAKNPTAPVDTMGCAELYWRGSSARDRRFHILVALMLSSQTKDTVTAVAMGRLHTELGRTIVKDEGQEKGNDEIKQEKEGEESKESTLTLENILAVPPETLNALIHTVGFHNNKTKYIKSTARILHDHHASDIPSTISELMSLPGVGPKMAYLCMSAAWNRHEGIGVDVHVHRITNLWGWHRTKNPEETRMALEGWLPREKWHEVNKLLVGLGQTVCLPVGRRCGECGLAGRGLCKSEITSSSKRQK